MISMKPRFVALKTVCATSFPATVKPRTSHKWNGEAIDYLLEHRPTDPQGPDYSKAMIAGPKGWELPWWYGKSGQQ